MKRLYIFAALSVILLSACSKKDYYEVDEYEWMRTHEEGTVAYVDTYTGNYIVETFDGFSVIESRDGSIPQKFDRAYAHFSSRGLQTIYNYHGNYFSTARIVETWLSWSDALYVLDRISY